MLRRENGATAQQIIEATGWMNTVRGFISLANSKLGLNISKLDTRNVGPNQTGSIGSSTIYHIAA